MKRFTQRLLTLLLVLSALGATAAALLLASGEAAFVRTYGVSMNPVYHEGDLVILARAEGYVRGDIVAYHVEASGEVALHRIVGGDPNGFTLKGDNNKSLDVDRPAADELIGKAVVHIPRAGDALALATSPPLLGLAAFALLGGAAPAATRRRRRRTNRRKPPMSRHTRTPGPATPSPGLLQAPLRGWTAGAAATGILGAALGAWAWSVPAGPASAPGPAGRMDFSYSAEVPRTPAYDDTTVRSPQPVFRKVTESVDVHYSYTGPEGTLTLAAEVSTPGGWQTSIPLDGPSPASGSSLQGTAQLDLADIQRRVDRAAAVTGLPTNPITLEVVPTVDYGDTEFAPALALAMSPLQLSVSDPASLSVSDDEPGTQAGAPALTLGRWSLPSGTARVLAPALLALSVAAMALLALLGRRHRAQASADAVAAIKRRWGSRIIEVSPTSPAPEGPLVDVPDVATLVRIAERYNLLVLHWSRSGVDTFVVQDDGTAYRYRIGEGQPAAPATTALTAG